MNTTDRENLVCYRVDDLRWELTDWQNTREDRLDIIDRQITHEPNAAARRALLELREDLTHGVTAIDLDGYLAALLQATEEEPVAVPVQATPSPLPWLTIEEAAQSVGLTVRSLEKRIIASGGAKIWAQCGRNLTSKAAQFDRDKFLAWWASPANKAPRRYAKPKRKH